MSWLRENCPRLAKACDDHRRFQEYARIVERNRINALLEAERVLAHRELQLVRAFATGDAEYIERRQRKLEASRRRVARLSQEAAA